MNVRFKEIKRDEELKEQNQKTSLQKISSPALCALMEDRELRQKEHIAVGMVSRC